MNVPMAATPDQSVSSQTITAADNFRVAQELLSAIMALFQAVAQQEGAARGTELLRQFFATFRAYGAVNELSTNQVLDDLACQGPVDWCGIHATSATYWVGQYALGIFKALRVALNANFTLQCGGRCPPAIEAALPDHWPLIKAMFSPAWLESVPLEGVQARLHCEHQLAARTAADREAARRLGRLEAALGTEMIPETSRQVAAEPPDLMQYCMHLVGDYWQVRFGEERGQFSRQKLALGYLAFLLTLPNREVTASQLSLATTEQRALVEATVLTGNPPLDSEAIQDIRQRLRQLSLMIEEEESPAARIPLEEEQEKLLRQLRNVARRKGFPNAPAQKAFNAAKKVLRTFIQQMLQPGSTMPAFGKYLTDHLSWSKGAFAYRPTGTPTPWNILP